MKKRADKDLIVLFILIPILLAGAFYLSDKFENRLPDYSAINKGVAGCSVFFDVLKELDYPVSRTLQPVKECDPRTIQIVVQNKAFDPEEYALHAWLEKGGILVYLMVPDSSDTLSTVDYTGSPFDTKIKPEDVDVDSLTAGMEEVFNSPVQAYGNLRIYRVHSGTVIVGSAASFTNRALTKDTDNAFTLARRMTDYGARKIVFNEAAMYAGIEKQTLWSVIPLELKFILFQLVIALAIFLYMKGKRFGKPIPLHEEVERSENEYLYSVASLYSQAKCWDLVLTNYYRSFLRELRLPHEEWLEHWEKEYPDSLKKARKVNEFMSEPLNHHSVKEYLQVVATLEHLKTIIRKRREINWKTWRKA